MVKDSRRPAAAKFNKIKAKGEIHMPAVATALKIRPLYDRIVVRRKEARETMRGGIIIPDTAKEKPQEAEVIAVGDGKFNDEGKRIKLDVKKGDTVLIGKYSGTDIKIDDEEYTIIREDEVLAIVE
jgi:chaperonin GroES